MISYKKVTLDDRDWMRWKLRESDLRGSEYCFTNQFLWGNVFGMEVTLIDGCLCTIYRREGNAVHDFPTGAGQTREAILALIEDDRNDGRKTIFRGILEAQKEWIEHTFPGMFDIMPKREDFDYLYLTDKLSSLSGRKLHSKRNHIARFEETGEWSYEEMTPENIGGCREMYQNWLIQNKDRLDDSIQKEQVLVEGCFAHFRDLKLEGGVLVQKGKVAGFSIGSPLNSDTFIVHIEKADTTIQGAYPMLNRQFVRHNMMDFQYVNREDDLGLEGLRKAKLSYYPDILLEKYEARLKNPSGKR